MKSRLDDLDCLHALEFLAVVAQHALGSFILQPHLQIGDAVMFAQLLMLVKYLLLQDDSLFPSWNSRCFQRRIKGTMSKRSGQQPPRISFCCRFAYDIRLRKANGC